MLKRATNNDRKDLILKQIKPMNKSDKKVQLIFTHNKVNARNYSVRMKGQNIHAQCTCNQLSFTILMYFCFFWLSNIMLVFLT